MVYSRNKELTKNQILETKGIATFYAFVTFIFLYNKQNRKNYSG